MAMGEGDKVNDSNFTPGRVMVILKANLDVEPFFLFLKFLFFHKHCNKKEEKHHSLKSHYPKILSFKYIINILHVTMLFTFMVFVTLYSIKLI